MKKLERIYTYFLSQEHIFALLARKIVNNGILILSRFRKNVCCPVCNWQGYKFLYTGRRRNARCPNCGSLERHRLQKLVMDKIKLMEFVKDGKILHFAPEKFFKAIFEKVAAIYVSADIQTGRGMCTMDIRNISFKKNTFTLVYASHVLEHLKQRDDNAAIKEIHRVLKLGGIAILPIPIHREGKTIEYGFSKKEDSGHFRSPGTDYFKKFEEESFSLQVFSSYNFDCKKWGLIVTKSGFGSFPDYVPVLTKLNENTPD